MNSSNKIASTVMCFALLAILVLSMNSPFAHALNGRLVLIAVLNLGQKLASLAREGGPGIVRLVEKCSELGRRVLTTVLNLGQKLASFAREGGPGLIRSGSP